MRSQNVWKVPLKLMHVTNISISTENQISKSVYFLSSEFPSLASGFETGVGGTSCTIRVEISVINNAFEFKVHCGRAFELVASGLPYYCTPPVCVPDVIGALAVWWQNITNKGPHSGGRTDFTDGDLSPNLQARFCKLYYADFVGWHWVILVNSWFPKKWKSRIALLVHNA